jgi:hypothetical protein
MRGAIPPLPQYAFMAWCSFKIKAQRQLYSNLCYCTIHLQQLVLSYLTKIFQLHWLHTQNIIGNDNQKRVGKDVEGGYHGQFGCSD